MADAAPQGESELHARLDSAALVVMGGSERGRCGKAGAEVRYGPKQDAPIGCRTGRPADYRTDMKALSESSPAIGSANIVILTLDRWFMTRL